MATFFGTGGADSLTGTNTSDQFYAGSGNDTITTGGGIDAVSAGDGNDVLNLVPGDSGQGEGGADIFKITAGSNPGLNNGTLTIYGDYAGLDADVLDVSALIADGWTLVTVGITSTDGQNLGGIGSLGYHGRMVLSKPGFTDISIVYNDIESFITTAPVAPVAGPVDGLAAGEVMGPGYTDAQGDQIDGTDGVNDTIFGNAGNDNIDAGAGNDTVDGGADNDTVTGGDGDDSVTGGTGADTLTGGAGNDTVDGGADNDTVTGGDGNDSVAGGAGTDTLAGGAGNDVLDGGAGDDDIAVGGADTATGGSGDDVFTLDATDPATDINATIDGGTDATSGNPDDAANLDAGDSLDLSAVTAAVTVNLATNPETGTVNGLDGDAGTDISFAEIEKILTGSGNDTVSGAGSTGPVNVDTGAGNDTIATGSGNDTIAAGLGDDTVAAGGGNDTVAGGDGNDVLSGGDGADTLDGGNNNDNLDGGAGPDSLVGGAGTDTLVGGEGADTLDGGLDDDDLVVGAGDQALGGDGDDVFTIDKTLTGTSPVTVTGGEASEDLSDPANGGAGDVLDLRGQTGVVVTYNTADPTYNPLTGVGESGTATYLNALGQSVTVNFSQIETVLRDPAGAVDGAATGEVMGPGYTDPQGDQIDGGDGLNDTIFGNAGNDSINAGAGNDTVDGGADSDTVAGGAGNDVLGGGAGDDDIAVGGADTATGGSGDDEFTLDATDPATDINATIDGGTDATSGNPDDTANGNAGDILNLSAVTAAVTVDLGTNPETGTVNGLDADGATDIAFAEIEKIVTGSGNDTINGGGANGPVNVDTGAGNDTIATGSGNDTIAAGPGNDTVDAGGGNDTVTGGDGTDSLAGGDGNDTLDGGADADTLDGGLGNDSLVGGDGADQITSGIPGTPDIGYLGIYAADGTPNNDLDTVYGGAGADTISTGDDRDLVYGGNEADSIDGGFDNDSLFGDDGADTILGGEGSDSIQGGADDDVIYGGYSDPALDGVNIPDATDLAPNNGLDTIYGGNGADQIFGQDDADSLFGDAGADTLDGGIDNDSLYGGADADSLTGGEGRDLLDGGAGVDVLTGGTGADAFVADGTADTITDFDVTTGIGDADTQNNDNVDLSAFYNASTLAAWNAANPGNTYNDPLDWLRADQADGVLQSAGGLRILNGGAAVAGTGLTTENTSVICFARGTQITTIRGAVAVEDLAVDDMVLTVDNGYKPIRWIGSRRIDGSGKFAPIQFEAGVLGNERPLTVSPQHRVQVKSSIAAKMFGAHDVLVAAKHLLGLPGVTQAPVAEVEYFHFLLDQHELVISDGAVTETLFTGPEALRAVEPAARQEILAIFPDLADLDHVRLTLPVRPLVTGRMGRQLAARHLRNNKRLVA